MDTYKQVLALQTKVEDQISTKKLTTATTTQLAVLKLAQGLQNPKLMAILYQKLGEILEKRGLIQKRVYAYEAAFKALNKQDHHLELTSRRLRQASKSFHQDRKIEIPDVFNPAIALSLEKALKEDHHNINILINIGNSYFAQPQIIPAFNAYQQVITQTNIDKYPLLKAQTLIKIGEIFRQQNKISLAKKNLKAAQSIFIKHGTSVDQRFANALQARLHFQAQKVDKAIPAYKEALSAFEQLGDSQNAAKVLAQMGQLFLGIGKFAASKDHYLRAIAYVEQLGSKSIPWHLFWGLGCCYWEEKDWPQAAIYYEKSKAHILKRQNKLYTDEGKVAFLESVQDVFDQLIKVYLKIGDKSAIEKAFLTAEAAKGQSLSDLMQGRKRRRAMPQKPTRDSTTQQMSSASPPILPTSNIISTDDFNQIMDAFESESDHAMIRQEAVGMPNAIPNFSSFPIVEDTDASKQLKRREISQRHFLCFYVLPDKLLIWLKKPDNTLQFHQWSISKKDLADKINNYRKGMLQDAESRGIIISRGVATTVEETKSRSAISRTSWESIINLDELSTELYLQIIGPFQNELTQLGATIVLIPHAFLWLFPFAALKNAAGENLGTQHTLLYSPSIKTLDQIDREHPYSEVKTAKALIIGNPKMSQANKKYKFSQLSGAQKEAKAIGEILKTSPILDQEATQNTIEERLESTNILHLATHGVADENNPLDSFIVLADKYDTAGKLVKDGILKAREVMHWSLPCELVNLSACQTALGKVAGEGMIGLSRAFLVAGSRSVLVSLWNISDTATAEFMQKFYEYYLEFENKGLALQRTMKFFQSSTQYQHAVYWSAFTLVGSDN